MTSDSYGIWLLPLALVLLATLSRDRRIAALRGAALYAGAALLAHLVLPLVVGVARWDNSEVVSDSLPTRHYRLFVFLGFIAFRSGVALLEGWLSSWIPWPARRRHLVFAVIAFFPVLAEVTLSWSEIGIWAFWFDVLPLTLTLPYAATVFMPPLIGAFTLVATMRTARHGVVTAVQCEKEAPSLEPGA